MQNTAPVAPRTTGRAAGHRTFARAARAFVPATTPLHETLSVGLGLQARSSDAR